MVMQVKHHAHAFPVDINNLPIIPIHIFGGNKEARLKAQTAFFIQTGVTAKIQTVKAAIAREATQVKNKAIMFVDDNTPLNSRNMLLVVGASHALLIDKNVTLSVQSPWFKQTTHTFYWQPDRYRMDLSIRF
jgi:hypothetical protein